MSWFLLNRNLTLLEPYDWKLSCTVLRGERGSNAPDLPGSENNPGTRYPRLEQSTHNFPNTDFPPVQTYLYDASYFRLKNIEVGYNFPRKWLSNLRLENVRVYVSGQNLFTITDVPQIDPENVNSQGWSYPQMKSFNAGISIQF